MISKTKEQLKRIGVYFHIGKLRRRLTNPDATLISNNCIAGVIYHDLAMKFNSPTINLSIKGEDYLEFCKDIEYYLECKLTEGKSEKYPVGILQARDCDHKSIQLDFIHYISFREASEKWEERKRRIDMQNIYYIWEFYDDCYDISLLKQWLELPLKHKIALTHTPFSGLNDVFYLDFYKGREDTGKIFKYRGISGKRYLDAYDYVAFLNER